ncbi:hypothetical protein BDZ91DRAFT_730426 [Kalaharituber pfeilii]|nr:hypothetical protein BDZ91DRAFT_730426 [Kalaharituber pfeilii]
MRKINSFQETLHRDVTWHGKSYCSTQRSMLHNCSRMKVIARSRPQAHTMKRLHNYGGLG